MSYSQKYSLVHFIKPVAINTSFEMTDWPVHITIAGTFAIERKLSGLNEKIRELLAMKTQFSVTAISQTNFGVLDVVLIEKTNELMELQRSIYELLLENGAEFNSPEYYGADYLPHSTIQKSDRLNLGESVIFDSLSLVDMFPDNDWKQRKVLKNYMIG